MPIVTRSREAHDSKIDSISLNQLVKLVLASVCVTILN